MIYVYSERKGLVVIYESEKRREGRLCENETRKRGKEKNRKSKPEI